MRRRLRAEFSKTDVNVKVREERRREAAIPNTTLFVAGFDPRTIRTRDLERAFEPFGRVKVKLRGCRAALPAACAGGAWWQRPPRLEGNSLGSMCHPPHSLACPPPAPTPALPNKEELLLC